MITEIGNLVSNPEPKDTTGGSLTKLRIASSERRKVNDVWTDGPTTYTNIECWRRVADIAATLKKGDEVIIVGELKADNYEKTDGTKVQGHKIVASKVAVVPKIAVESKVLQTANTEVTNDPWV